MRSTSEIKKQITFSVQKNFFKIVASLFTMTIITSAATVMIGLPIIGFVSNIGSASSLFTTFFISIALQLLMFFLVYGFVVLTGRFYKNEPAVIGYLLQGFRDWKRVMKIAVLASAVSMLISAAVAITAVIIVEKNIPAETGSEMPLITEEMPLIIEDSASAGETAPLSSEELSPEDLEQLLPPEFGIVFKILPILLLVYFVLIAVVFLPFIFSFQILYHEPELRPLEVLKKSRAFIKGKIFSFLLFCLKCTAVPLVTAAVSTALCFVIPAKSVFNGLSNFISTVALYYTLIYAAFAQNAYYYEMQEPDTLCLSSPEIPEQN